MHTHLDNSFGTVKAQTRAERRRLEKEQAKNKVSYTLTRESLLATQQEAYNRGRQAAIEEDLKLVEETMFNCFVIALHDKEGFGEKRINRVLESVKNHVESLELGLISHDDLKNISNTLNDKARRNIKSTK